MSMTLTIVAGRHCRQLQAKWPELTRSTYYSVLHQQVGVRDASQLTVRKQVLLRTMLTVPAERWLIERQIKNRLKAN